ncbi:MAG: hypothetical protein JSW11_02010 [Candidatus Heimdallarchaeota archaeon]|nr:MAG: hypothetical protein JSW11_02010 [Candidatus Heimdallarchaeota archaeon]
MQVIAELTVLWDHHQHWHQLRSGRPQLAMFLFPKSANYHRYCMQRQLECYQRKAHRKQKNAEKLTTQITKKTLSSRNA